MLIVIELICTIDFGVLHIRRRRSLIYYDLGDRTFTSGDGCLRAQEYYVVWSLPRLLSTMTSGVLYHLRFSN